MSQSDNRPKKIPSQQKKKLPNTPIIPSQQKKNKKESTRKISLKQSVLKQHKDPPLSQLSTNPKKSHQIISDYDHKYKIVKELQILTKQDDDRRKGSKFSNLSKNNKSLIFLQHKLTNPHHSSTLKASKIFPTENKAGSTTKKEKDQSYTHKKGSQKDSTTKKHSKSVYNYTEFDEFPEKKQVVKKNYPKQSIGNNSRYYHNKSALTQQGHQVSTSSITKRVSKSKQILKKLLNNADIKKKTGNFKILSNCLQTYIKEEQLLDNKVDVGQIIKLVKAFNKVEISKMSRPLEKLISQMIEIIQETVDKNSKQTLINRKKQSIQKCQTPQRLNHKSFNGRQSSIKKSMLFNAEEINQNPNDISKTKKVYPEDYNHFQKDNEGITEQNYQSSLSKDLIKMEQGLNELRTESKQLKQFIHESSSKKSRMYQSSQRLQFDEKRSQINKLKQILQKQKLILQKIDTYSDSQKQKSSSAQSSLKCFQTFEE